MTLICYTVILRLRCIVFMNAELLVEFINTLELIFMGIAFVIMTTRLPRRSTRNFPIVTAKLRSIRLQFTRIFSGMRLTASKAVLRMIIKIMYTIFVMGHIRQGMIILKSAGSNAKSSNTSVFKRVVIALVITIMDLLSTCSRNLMTIFVRNIPRKM